MKKVIVTVGIGFAGAYHEEEFEFPNYYTESDIEDEIYNWAKQFLDIRWEVIGEEDENE